MCTAGNLILKGCQSNNVVEMLGKQLEKVKFATREYCELREGRVRKQVWKKTGAMR